MFAPIVNPYDSSMTKEEKRKTWEKWTTKRKLMYVLARRFPSLLPYFYRRSFLSGKQGKLEKWLSLSLGKKVCPDLAFTLLEVENASSLSKWSNPSSELSQLKCILIVNMLT